MSSYAKIEKLVVECKGLATIVLCKCSSIDDEIDAPESELKKKIAPAKYRKFQAHLDDVAKTASAILKEAPVFLDAIVDSPDDLSACPTLQQVWEGDMYGDTRTKGLEALREDLNQAIGNLTPVAIVKEWSK
jgi:hypothetical protein